MELSKAVLMAPGSTTHSSDMSARYFELEAEGPQWNRMTFLAPLNDKLVPRGIYMLFLVTKKGGVSETTWVVLR